MKVRYVGPFGQASGYGHACMDNVAAMVEANIALDIVPIMGFNEEDVHLRYQHLLGKLCQDPNDWTGITHCIVHAIPFGLQIFIDELQIPNHVTKIAYTTWETTKLPYGCAKDIDQNYDLTIVPCGWNRATFKKAGIEKVVAVPHAFDPRWWYPVIKRQDLTKPYHFYSILTWCARKGPIELLKAYFTAFTKDDPPTKLTIVTPSYSREDVESLARCMGLDWLPEVEFVGKVGMRLSDETLRDLHREADCYVTAARGEGWGLGAFEAMLNGNVVIAPAFGGFQDFLGSYINSRQVETFLTPAITPETTSGNVLRVAGMEIKPVVLNAPTGIIADQNWAEPNLNRLRMHMRSAALMRAGKNHSQYNYLCDLFSWRAVGNKFRHVLEAI